MLSPTVERKARSHLRLAEGLMKTAQIADGASEFEIRNAFSRSYYALFHACYAHLLASGTDATKAAAIARDHGRLQSAMRRPMGKPFERFLKSACETRHRSDYKPEWTVPAAAVAQKELSQAKKQFYFLLFTVRRMLK